MLAKNKKGFSLIEILIAITLITMLASIVIIAVNPGRQFAQGRNTQRWTAVTSILNSVHQNMVDNNGVWTCDADGDGTPEPTGDDAIPSSATNIGSGVVDYDLCDCIVPDYVAAMPYDPSTGSHTDCTIYDTGYEISQDATSKRVTVSAPDSEIGTTISITR